MISNSIKKINNLIDGKWEVRDVVGATLHRTHVY